jgi:hypothetical protein
VVLQTEISTQGVINTVVELPAEADAYIASEWPDYSFGSDALYLGYNLPDGASFGAERPLLHFDVLSTVPIDAVINAAHLRLHLNSSDPAEDESMGTILRRTASDWDESTVTWNSEPAWGEPQRLAPVRIALSQGPPTQFQRSCTNPIDAPTQPFRLGPSFVLPW